MTIFRQITLKSSTRMQVLVDKFKEHEEKKTWNNVFMALQNESETQAEKLGFTYNEATKDKNQIKNRYCNVIPWDHNRVTLSSSKNDYINASPLHSDLTGRDYIFAQGPLDSTSGDFWQMVYEKESNIIVMLTDCLEFGQVKCHQYFPSKESKTLRFGAYNLELIEETSNKFYTVRKMKLTPKKGSSTDSRVVHHFQFTNWPDFGVPDDSYNFEKFVEAVRDLDDSFDEHKPIVTHCSAGIGRSGTFVVADIFLSAFRSGKTDNFPLIDELILNMRQSRMYLVQTPGQLRFCWQAIVNWIKRSANSTESKTENGAKSSSKPKNSETNGETEKDESTSTANNICSPGKRSNSTDDDVIALQKRRQTIENMKRRQRQFEERKGRRDYWFKQIPYILAVSTLVGVTSVLIYRYVGTTDSSQSFNIS